MEIVQALLLCVVIYLLHIIAEELKKPAKQEAIQGINRELMREPLPRPGEMRGVNLHSNVKMAELLQHASRRMTPSEIARDLEQKAEKRARSAAAQKLKEKTSA